VGLLRVFQILITRTTPARRGWRCRMVGRRMEMYAVDGKVHNFCVESQQQSCRLLSSPVRRGSKGKVVAPSLSLRRLMYWNVYRMIAALYLTLQGNMTLIGAWYIVGSSKRMTYFQQTIRDPLLVAFQELVVPLLFRMKSKQGCCLLLMKEEQLIFL